MPCSADIDGSASVFASAESWGSSGKRFLLRDDTRSQFTEVCPTMQFVLKDSPEGKVTAALWTTLWVLVECRSGTRLRDV